MTGVVVFSDTIFPAPLSAFDRSCSRLDNAIQHIDLYPLDSVYNIFGQHLSTEQWFVRWISFLSVNG